MGSFASGGVAGEMEKLVKMQKGTDEACAAAVKAGAKVLVDALKEAVPYQHGDLQRSIRAGSVEHSAANGFYSRVGPKGKNARGEAYAKIGNVLEYGRTARVVDPGRDIAPMDARPWFYATVARVEGQVTAAMEKAFSEAQDHE